MAKKEVGQKWKKVGQSKTVFFEPWKAPQDIQGFLTSCEKKKATRKFGSQMVAVIMKNTGEPVQIKGSVQGGLGKFLNTCKVGSKIRILHHGGNLEDGRSLPKGIKDYKSFKKWKKKERFFADQEYFVL